jgi:hypothetical protein
MPWFHVCGLDERLQTSMISTGIDLCHFPIKTNLYYCTISLLMKHINALESRNAWAYTITSLFHLTMIGTKKHGVKSKERQGPFSLHDASTSKFMVSIKT